MKIWEWLENLRRRWFGETENEEGMGSSYHGELAQVEMNPPMHHPPSTVMGEEVEVRVAYLYPTKQVRTGRKKEQSEEVVEHEGSAMQGGQSATTSAMSGRFQEAPSLVPASAPTKITIKTEPAENVEHAKQRPPFQPSYVPSPIHGFRKRMPVERVPGASREVASEEAERTVEITEEVAAEFAPEKTEAELEQAAPQHREEPQECGKGEQIVQRQQTESPLQSLEVEATPLAPTPLPTSISTSQKEPRLSQQQQQVKRDPQGQLPREAQLPSLSLLQDPPPPSPQDETYIAEQMGVLQETLQQFHVDAEVRDATQGPTVTRFEVYPGPGVKVNKVTNLADDIQLSMAVEEIRMEAPIPGKSAIGIEVPNRKREAVWLQPLLTHSALHGATLLTVPLGLDIGGDLVTLDLQKMPHGLIAGSTGSGKSVCINSIITSLLFRATADEVKLLLIDPKMVEFAAYHDIPHLVTPVVNDSKEATQALAWAVQEMERRYEVFADLGVRDIQRYNMWMAEHEPGRTAPAMPYLVVVIDELADLMMVAPADVEESIARLAQKARACGIHLLVATQRPSVDVITGLIKANIPTRIAFAVSAQTDSRTILDMAGAEKLLGRGDMLYLPNGSSKPIRLQGAFLKDEEIERVTESIKMMREPEYLFDRELLQREIVQEEEDELFPDAVKFVMDAGQASTSALQRRFRIGYNRAARLMDMMEDQGFISASAGSKPRSVLINAEEYEEYFALG